jgi:hypothetical protein
MRTELAADRDMFTEVDRELDAAIIPLAKVVHSLVEGDIIKLPAVSVCPGRNRSEFQGLTAATLVYQDVRPILASI